MGWSVYVVFPKENHPLAGSAVTGETVVSFSSSPGNIACAVSELGFPKLPHCESNEQCMDALAALIQELKKGNEGKFTDEWAVAADQSWSQGAETKEAWKSIAPYSDKLPDSMNTYEKFTGRSKRETLIQDAERFYLYYLAGCTVSFEW